TTSFNKFNVNRQYATVTQVPKDTKSEKKKSPSLFEYDVLIKDEMVIDPKGQSNYFVFGDTKVSDILDKKRSTEILTTTPDSKIIEALETMTKKDVGAILVVNDKEELIGIFTERDYMRKVTLAGLSSRVNTIKEVMTTGVKTITKDLCVVETMQIMTNQRFRHLPVVDPATKKIVGVVSIQDCIKSVHDNQKETIKYLREFLNDANSYSMKHNKKW
ncbi:hypothetical protein SAMD00019534_006720, partial [Acytostelium subglobosum LB1]|uniref:hypothetical protein n=1 Tax=Acytostelium subglobosum LB1 TaxID=1410327 RepID=UPI000644F82A